MSLLLEAIRQGHPDGNVATYEESLRRFHDLFIAGETVVVATGSHEIIHEGHALWWQRIRRFAGNLPVAVGVEERETIEANKKKVPVFDARERAAVIGEARSVDWAFILPSDPPVRYDDPESFMDRYRQFGRIILVAPNWDPFNPQRKIQVERTGRKGIIFVELEVPKLPISSSAIARRIQQSKHRY